MELWQRLKDLEKKVAELEIKLDVAYRAEQDAAMMAAVQNTALRAQLKATGSPDEPIDRGPKEMCPKCGVKKAYHFHVKHCKGAG